MEIKLNKKEKRIIEVVFDRYLETTIISDTTKEEIKDLKYKLINK